MSKEKPVAIYKTQKIKEKAEGIIVKDEDMYRNNSEYYKKSF